ncbi:MAG: hypothetical protein ACREI2_15415 [Nitrospiraceae bacterium]
MKTSMRGLAKRSKSPLVLLPVILAIPVTVGCVSIDDYRAAKREAERLQTQLQTEQQRSQDLETRMRQLGDKNRDLEGAVRTAREEADRQEREYKEVRDELLKFKIEQEQQRVSSNRSRMRGESLKREPDATPPTADLGPRSNFPSTTEDSKKRLRQALQEFQRLLESN